MNTSDERMHILQMIDAGQISASEGLRLIEALPRERAEAASPPAAEAILQPGGQGENASGTPFSEAAASGAAEKPEPPPNLSHWQNWWLIPMWVGIGVTTLGAWLMYGAYAASRTFSGWFWLATLLVFAPGVAVMALAAASRTSKWIHIRVKSDQGGANFALSFPVPIRLTAWFLRIFGRYIPNLRNTGVDELILALSETASPENPLYVEVNEGEADEKVEVYVG